MQFWKKRSRLEIDEIPVWLRYVAIFSVVAGIFTYIQWSRSFMDPDSFYHAKMAVLMRDHGIVRDFLWLPFTTLGQAYADHHFLYHVLLIPFVMAFGPLVGIKVATVVFASAAVTAFYALLRVHGVRHAGFYALVLATIGSFIFRLNLAKTSAISLLALLLALILIRKDKPLALFFLAWAYVWLYGGWPIMAVIVAIYIGTRVVVDRLVDKHPHRSWAGRWFWKRLFSGSRNAVAEFFGSKEVRHALAAAGGLLCGIVINPYFPNNLRFYWEQIVQIAVVGYRDKIGVGSEWYPYPLESMLIENAPVFLLVFIAVALLLAMVFWSDIVRRGRGGVPRDELTPQLAGFFLAGFFLLMALRSRRHVEYFVPFAMFAVSLFLNMLLARLDASILVAKLRKLYPKPRFIVPAFGVYTLIMFAMFGARGVRDTAGLYHGGIPWDKYAGSAAWLASHTEEGAVIVHSDWDDFPVLFFHNDHNRYIAGLDPTFLYRQDPERYWTWEKITTGKQKEGIAAAVRDRFGARHLFIENDHKEMREAVEADGGFRKIYEDDEVRIYILR